LTSSRQIGRNKHPPIGINELVDILGADWEIYAVTSLDALRTSGELERIQYLLLPDIVNRPLEVG
jgi:hypothetical protein